MRYTKVSNITYSFIPWQPSTWPGPFDIFTDDIHQVMEKIFHESILFEINSVINDAPTLERRGHVIALSILCSIDTFSSYAFNNLEIERCEKCGRSDSVGPRYKKFISRFFPSDYKKHAGDIYKLYRNPLTHSWNLFEAGMLPGNEKIKKENGIINLGLLNFHKALNYSVQKYLNELKKDKELQEATLVRYNQLKQTANP